MIIINIILEKFETEKVFSKSQLFRIKSVHFLANSGNFIGLQRSHLLFGNTGRLLNIFPTLW